MKDLKAACFKKLILLLQHTLNVSFYSTLTINYRREDAKNI